MTPFYELVEALQPGASGSQIAALLDNRAKRTAALNWKAGRRGTPLWAIELLKAKLRRRIEQDCELLERKIPERLGLKAGARNLAIYRQRISRGQTGS